MLAIGPQAEVFEHDAGVGRDAVARQSLSIQRDDNRPSKIDELG